MVTTNFYLALNAQTMKNFANVNQTAGQATVICNQNAGGYYATGVAGQYVDVGYGNTAETVGDYKLADSNAYSGTQVGALTYLSSTKLNTSPYVVGAATAYMNNTENDIVVTEVGLVGKSGTTANQPNYNILLARKVLDTPITVPAGGGCVFKYGIKVSS